MSREPFVQVSVWLFAAFGALRAIVEVSGRWRSSDKLIVTVTQTLIGFTHR